MQLALDLRRRAEECGYHCAGQSVPLHACEPIADPAPNGERAPHAAPAAVVPRGAPMRQWGMAATPACRWTPWSATCANRFLAPPRAVVLRDGAAVERPTSEVAVGDRLLIRPGARVPVDAVVGEGESEIDESTVTGESISVSKSPGSQLIGATIDRNGTLRASATRVGADTALAQIVKLVQEAQNSKAPGQRLAGRAAFWLVLVALVGGTMMLLVWLGAGAGSETAILFAITVVVITCPDALGLATPTAIITGLGARRGILFKSAIALEISVRIQAAVMDKTGTVTKGEPEVTDVVAAGMPEAELLMLETAAERESEHPAGSVGRAAGQSRRAGPRSSEQRWSARLAKVPVPTLRASPGADGNLRIGDRVGSGSHGPELRIVDGLGRLYDVRDGVRSRPEGS